MTPPEPALRPRAWGAALIPAAGPPGIPAGTEVRITQSLGGTYTVWFDGGMARIENKDADALGLKAEQSAFDAPGAEPLSPEEMEKQIWTQMRTCYDPEIPV